MSRRKATLILIVSLAIIGGAYLFAYDPVPGSSASARASTALDDSSTLYGVRTVDELIEFWRGRVDRDPRDYISLAYLGQAFLRQARETGDIRAYDRAESGLRQALLLNPDYETALAYLSAVLLAKHEFAGSLDLARRVYSFDPRALQALATVGDAHLALGNYDAAKAAYLELAERNPSPPVSSRLARLSWLKDRPDEALRLMQSAADEAVDLGLTGERVAWYEFQLGELYFNTGRINDAVEHYSAAVNLFDNYRLALSGLGKARAAQGFYQEAIELYSRALEIIPDPTTFARLGDLYAKTGDSVQAQVQYDSVEFIAKLATINRQVYNRQLVLFYANHDLKVEEALDLATSELEVRKDVYGYDALAWALHKNNRNEEAAEAIRQALSLGTPDSNIYYHAGMIQLSLGNREQARAYLERAMEINPNFSVLQGDIARQALAELGTQEASSSTIGGTP